MVKGKKKWWFSLGALVFVLYIFIAALPVPRETVLKPRWISSLESNYPINLGDFTPRESGKLIPFTLGERFGYLDGGGNFTLNQTKSRYISLSENYWAEYGAVPESITVMNPANERVISIENQKGYPLFPDNRIFVAGSEQNSLSELGPGGETLWTYDFPAPLTCVDAASGTVLAGTLDGALILLDSSGKPVFTPFEPGGSRLSVILGCAVSRDSKRLAVISGIDNQRFLLLEYSGDTYKVIYHEFLGEGFRRPVHVEFVDNDNKVAFERQGGLGIYDINSRSGASLKLDEEITMLDDSGGDRFLFVISSLGPERKHLVTIRYPGVIVNKAPFRSGQTFFARRGNTVFLGSGSTMASLELEEK